MVGGGRTEGEHPWVKVFRQEKLTQMTIRELEHREGKRGRGGKGQKKNKKAQQNNIGGGDFLFGEDTLQRNERDGPSPGGRTVKGNRGELRT